MCQSIRHRHRGNVYPSPALSSLVQSPFSGGIPWIHQSQPPAVPCQDEVLHLDDVYPDKELLSAAIGASFPPDYWYLPSRLCLAALWASRQSEGHTGRLTSDGKYWILIWCIDRDFILFIEGECEYLVCIRINLLYKSKLVGVGTIDNRPSAK